MWKEDATLNKILCPSQSEELMRFLDSIEMDLRQIKTPRIKKTADLVLKRIDALRSEYGLGVKDSG